MYVIISKKTCSLFFLFKLKLWKYAPFLELWKGLGRSPCSTSSLNLIRLLRPSFRQIVISPKMRVSKLSGQAAPVFDNFLCEECIIFTIGGVFPCAISACRFHGKQKLMQSLINRRLNSLFINQTISNFFTLKLMWLGKRRTGLKSCGPFLNEQLITSRMISVLSVAFWLHSLVYRTVLFLSWRRALYQPNLCNYLLDSA